MQFDPDCLHHPVLPKPQIPAPPLNRPFLWGFSLVSFRSFRLWRHVAVSEPDFSLPSLRPKIPFPASGFSTARSRSAAGNFWGMEAKNDVSNPVHNLRIQSKGFELWAPFCRSITKSLDSNTARQTTFDRGADEIWCEERERNRHVDLTHAALLTCCDLLNVGHGAQNDLVKPATTSGDGADEARATFDPRWTDFTFGDAVWNQNLPRF